MKLYIVIHSLWVVYLVWISIGDIQTRKIKNSRILAGICLCAAKLFLGEVMVRDMVEGGIFVFVLAYISYRIGAIGSGDVKLYSLLGLVLGLERGLYLLWYSYVICVISTYIYQGIKKKKVDKVALAPYILVAYLLCNGRWI